MSKLVREIALQKHKWTLGSAIGDASGFGRVYRATAEDGTIGAVKLIPKRPGADRELLFEDVSAAENVVPIVDAGETVDDWVIAMPLAERSLRAELKSVGGPVDLDDALRILTDITKALVALDGRVVHRDLKPENVLLLNGVWCLSDFGIARYTDATTAPDTWKYHMTAAYAAPERWTFQRATSATDVYSLAVIAFEMLEGHPPFPGPDPSDYRDQHLGNVPPRLTVGTAALASLLAESLLKPPGARPTAARFLARLQRVQEVASPAANRLQEVNQAIVAKKAGEHAASSAAATEDARRAQLFDACGHTFAEIRNQLRDAVVANAPSAIASPESARSWSLKLGEAVLSMNAPQRTSTGAWGVRKVAIDVVAHASIVIEIRPDRYGYRGRGHSIWYCDAHESGVYRWYETAFMINPIMQQTTAAVPIYLDPGSESAEALSSGMTKWEVAWPFEPVDQGDEGEFIERWLNWLALAASGALRSPSTLPERQPHGTWRR